MAWGPWGARKQREAAGSSRALCTVTARPGVTVGAPLQWPRVASGASFAHSGPQYPHP